MNLRYEWDNRSLATPPRDDDAFDIYLANEGFHKIQRVAVMEQFLLRAAKRFHALDKELGVALETDDLLPDMKQKAWAFLSEQFSTSTSDLRMFFSETDNWSEQTPEECKRLNAVADALICSARDQSKIDYAESLGSAAQISEDDSPSFGMRP